MLPAALDMIDDGGAKIGKRARKRRSPDTVTAQDHVQRHKQQKTDNMDQPAASAGNSRKSDKPKGKPKGKPKAKPQTGSRRQLRNAGVKTSHTSVEQATSLLQPAGLQRSDGLKRKVESLQDHAEADITVSQPNKRARTAEITVGMDEEQTGAAFPADAALNSECSNARQTIAAVLSADAAPSVGCSNARQKTVRKGAAKDNAQPRRRRLHRTSGVPVANCVPHRK
jgi:hypothetical protein